MSTRANIRITSEGLGWKEEVQLYRHCDGYPESVLPSLAKAYKWSGGSGGNWAAGRPAKAAAFIIAANYEPAHEQNGVSYPPYTPYELDGLRLHGDIDWLYRVIVITHSRFYTDRGPTWEVEVYKPMAEFWNEPSFENCRLIKRGEVTQMAKHAAEIQREGYARDKIAEVVQ